MNLKPTSGKTPEYQFFSYTGKRDQPRCVRRLSFSDNEASGNFPCKRIRLDEDVSIAKKGEICFFLFCKHCT